MKHDWLADQVVRDQLRQVELLLVGIGSRPVNGERVHAQLHGEQVHAQLICGRSKRVRPALLLLAARLGAGSSYLSIVAAAAVELVHEATLYHDDIVDESDLRRGIAAAHVSVGTRAAALAGSELLYAAAELAADLPADLREQIGRLGPLLWWGLLRELETVGEVIAPSARLRVMAAKSASAFRLSVRLGAGLAGAPVDVRRDLSRFAFAFGLAFQLADDIADVVGTDAALGRPVGTDLRNGLYTLPVLYALASRDSKREALAGTLRSLRQAADPDLVGFALRLTEELGGILRARELLRSLLAVALDALGAAASRLPQESHLSLLQLVKVLAAEERRLALLDTGVVAAHSA